MSRARTGSFIPDGLQRRGGFSPRIVDAISRVPRHRFVPESVVDFAYEDRALPIGREQTISQPYIVALMTENSSTTAGKKVLEIGTGSGYQSAVLLELGAEVFTIELIPELAKRAESILQELGYSNVHVRCSDGWQGWPEEAPFDAILITAAAPAYPPALLEQLAIGGKMVIPIEDGRTIGTGESLKLVTKLEKGPEIKTLGPVRFVPLQGAARQLA